jgi:N-acetyl-anhydromuramyl-L-alanine amidase AmpD
MNIKASCDKTYTAYHTSGTRDTSDIKWIVVHDEEADTAKQAAQYFTEKASGGSAHLCVDDTMCYRTLENDEIPWAAASAPTIGANTHGFHIEMAGFAKWSAVIWEKHTLTLQRAAFKTALHCQLFGIPVVWVPTYWVVRLKKGITSHAEISKASKIVDPDNASRYSHTDPGPFWPRDKFMKYVRQYYLELSL